MAIEEFTTTSRSEPKPRSFTNASNKATRVGVAVQKLSGHKKIPEHQYEDTRLNHMFEFLGAVIGGLLGFVGPIFYAQFYVARGGDPTAAGGLFILDFITVPAGIVIGAVIGFIIRLLVKRSKG